MRRLVTKGCNTVLTLVHNSGLAIVMAENVKGISQLNPPGIVLPVDALILSNLFFFKVEWDKLCPLFDNLSPQTFP